jgi:tRNA pseudouridine55 synthase
MDALFNVNKPRGPTSHDVVARLRRASGERHIGHAGTLDPLAEGVLIVAAGKATRLVEYLMDAGKVYEAEVSFGVTTETYDAEGRVVAERPVTALTAQDVEEALAQFRGTIEQRPPPHSAVSVGGQRLYHLARQGKPVVAPPRQVTISRLELTSWERPRAVLMVACSKGTYVRSLAHDLGQALGSGAHLSRLVRQQVGPFHIAGATPLADLEERLRQGHWQDAALPLDAAIAHLHLVRLDDKAAGDLRHGKAVAASPPGPAMASPLPASGTLGRAYAPDGRLLAVVRLEGGDTPPVWRPVKVLAG